MTDNVTLITSDTTNTAVHSCADYYAITTDALIQLLLIMLQI